MDNLESSVLLPMEDSHFEHQQVEVLQVVEAAMVHQSLEALHQNRRLLAENDQE